MKKITIETDDLHDECMSVTLIGTDHMHQVHITCSVIDLSKGTDLIMKDGSVVYKNGSSS